MDISLKRIIAYIIDIAIVTVVVTLITNISFINPKLDEYNESYNAYLDLREKLNSDDEDADELADQMVDVNYQLGKTNVVNGVVTVVALVLYFGVFQLIMHGQTVGKRIMKLQLVSNKDNKKLHFGNYFLRTVILNNVIFRIFIIIGVFLMSKTMYYQFTSVISFLESIVESVILLMVVLKKDNRGIHDMIAGTKVIDCGVSEDKKDKIIEADVKEVKTRESKTNTKKKNIRSN